MPKEEKGFPCFYRNRKTDDESTQFSHSVPLVLIVTSLWRSNHRTNRKCCTIFQATFECVFVKSELFLKAFSLEQQICLLNSAALFMLSLELNLLLLLVVILKMKQFSTEILNQIQIWSMHVRTSDCVCVCTDDDNGNCCR